MESYKEHHNLVKEIAEILNLDKRVVNAICHHFLASTANVVRDKENLRPVRFRHLATLAIIGNKKKK